MLAVATAPAIDLVTRKQEIHNAHDTAMERLIECGRLLVDTQRQLDESTFLDFCDTLKFSRSTAYNYMKLYQHSLVQRLDTLQHAMINMSVWYIVPPQDTETVNKVIELANQNKPVTKELARQLVNETMPLNEAMAEAAETAPSFVAETIITGKFTDIEGNDQPVSEINRTDIQVSVDQQLYESAQRQRMHIQDNAKKKVKLECHLELVQVNGRYRLALPETVSAILKNKLLSIYYDADTSELESEARAS